MRIKKVYNKSFNVIMWIVGIVASLGIGGLFINGTFMNTFLNFLPLLVHQIVGWTIVAATVLAVIAKIFRFK